MSDIIDQRWDSGLQAIEGLEWLPWVGFDYANTLEARILILGESNYDWEEGEGKHAAADRLANPQFTRQLIQEDHVFNRPHSHQKFFRNTERLMYARPHVLHEQRCTLWRRLCYFNLVQRPMVSEKHRPTQEDYHSGWKIAAKVIDILKPTHCIVCGSNSISYGALKEVATEYRLSNEKEIGPKIGRTYARAITLNTQCATRLIFIRHPSKYFCWSRWSEFVSTEIPVLRNDYGLA